eukprot:CAMPEP_0184298698 /NCGR_PEP_ID=MMETSP1049-20130417/9453_1 /TAXON_ID=77928 /ORGANISM="Proteomonas sulcata, Strain CCMP704" /LENGTH=336 /DNA_ID=CAMNT_0026608905 /DNA_START=233 /DNA_END=1243 /DNA_ORIENTATION=+
MVLPCSGNHDVCEECLQGLRSSSSRQNRPRQREPTNSFDCPSCRDTISATVRINQNRALVAVLRAIAIKDQTEVEIDEKPTTKLRKRNKRQNGGQIQDPKPQTPNLRSDKTQAGRSCLLVVIVVFVFLVIYCQMSNVHQTNNLQTSNYPESHVPISTVPENPRPTSLVSSEMTSSDGVRVDSSHEDEGQDVAAHQKNTKLDLEDLNSLNEEDLTPGVPEMEDLGTLTLSDEELIDDELAELEELDSEAEEVVTELRSEEVEVEGLGDEEFEDDGSSPQDLGSQEFDTERVLRTNKYEPEEEEGEEEGEEEEFDDEEGTEGFEDDEEVGIEENDEFK